MGVNLGLRLLLLCHRVRGGLSVVVLHGLLGFVS
jgi:hypothetical protein